MTRRLLQAYLPEDQTTGALAAELFRGIAADATFDVIRVFAASRKLREWKFTDRSVERLGELGPLRQVEIAGETTTISVNESTAMTMISLSTTLPITDQTIGTALGFPGLHACLLGDFEDQMWQSTRFVSRYERAGRDYSHLPLDETSASGGSLDISGNPGRWSTVPGLVLWPAAHMWLGPVAIEYYGGLDHLLAFEDVPVRVVNGLVEIELYEIDDPEPLIRQRQRSFRDWVGMDDLETNPDRWIKAGDPAVHLNRKVVDGVERTVMTQWFNAAGELTKRSKAVLGRRAVIADDGEQISSTEIEP